MLKRKSKNLVVLGLIIVALMLVIGIVFKDEVQKLGKVLVIQSPSSSRTLEKIEVKTTPTKLEYIVGETLNTEGLVLKLTYDNGYIEEVVDENSDLAQACTPYILTKSGKQTITVQYLGKTTTFTVTVKADSRSLEKIEVKTPPTKLEYIVGERINTKGLVLKLTYDNEDIEEIEDDGLDLVQACTPIQLTTAGEQTITVQYLGKTTTFTVTVTEETRSLEKIEVKTTPTKLEYIVGETLNTEGLVLKLTYDNGDIDEIEDDGFYLVQACTPIQLTTVGEQTITVQYLGKTTTFTVTVIEEILEQITVETMPTKTVYIEGETLDTSGLILRADYNKGSTRVTEGYVCTPTKLNEVGEQTITVSYRGETTTFTVTVTEGARSLEKIEVKTPPTKLEYIVGERINTKGLVLKLTYDNGDTEDVVDENSDLAQGCTPIQLTTTGEQTITVSYRGETTTFTVTVREHILEQITVETMPTKTVYIEGETLDTSGLVLRADYNNGSTRVIEGYICTPTQLTTIGEQTITVSYGEKTATFVVNVICSEHIFRASQEGEEEDSHYCTRCGYSETHDYSEVVTQPTCTEAGYTTHTCTVCNYNYNDSETEPLGHNYTEVVTQPTCIEEGYTTHTCTACGDTYTDEEKPPLGHNYEAQTIAPTCTESGYTLHTCARCQENYKDNYKDPAGHRLITTITPPTCTEAGYTTYDCENCDFSYNSNYTAPTGHKYVGTITPPTCTEEGYTTYTCSVCNNHSYRTEYTKALGHTYQNGECVVCGIEAPAVEVASDEYGVLEAYITEIQPKTTVEILKLKLETNASSIAIYKENIDGTKTYISNQELVVTGMKIKLSLNDKEIIYTLVVKGDVNGDGYADFKDMVEINKFRLRRTILENAYKLAGDVTEDEEIGFRDMVEINKYRLNRIVVL